MTTTDRALGFKAFEQGDYVLAARHLERALSKDSIDLKLMTMLGNALKHIGEIDRALKIHEDLTKKHPSNAEAWSNLASVYLAAGALDAALTGFEKAANLCPENAEILYNFGIGLQHKGRLKDAMSIFRQVLGINVRHGAAWNSLGVVLKRLGSPHAAYTAQMEAVSIEPNNADFQWNLALTELLLGVYDKGFERYEWRRKMPGYKNVKSKDWKGEPAPGKDLVVYCEQGLGDTFNFLRFVKEAKKRVGKVKLRCQESLIPLLKACFDGADEIAPLGQDSEVKLSVPLLSLPHILKMTDRLGMDRPYLNARDDLRLKWRQKLKSNKVNIGICWQGNPTQKDDVNRSILLNAFEPLADSLSFNLFSLQKKHGIDQLQQRPDLKIIDLGSELDNENGAFVDTAAVIQELDVLIAVDTSLAHLAGALGARVWMLLPTVPDYRWGLAEQPWYPSMRVYRKSKDQNWADVMQGVKKDLEALTTEIEVKS